MPIKTPKNTDADEVETALAKQDEMSVDTYTDESMTLDKNYAQKFPHLVTYRDELHANPDLSWNQKRFLLAFSTCGIVGHAANAAGMTPQCHRIWLRTSASYRVAFDLCDSLANEYLESLALELASGVHLRPVVSMGRIVTYEKIFDTKLLQTLLRARMPHKYSSKVDVTSNGQTIVKLIDKAAFDAV